MSIKKYLEDPGYYAILAYGKLLPDTLKADAGYLKLLYKYKMKKPLDLEHPTTFNEKLQWLKLYDRRPEYTTMVDKYDVKNYVASIIGEEYVIKTLGVWDKFEDIDFDSLPDRFVLKCTHDSGGIVICRDKSVFDKKKAEKIIKHSLRRRYYFGGREWPYKNVPPRIIAEEYLEDCNAGSERVLTDYKFFCFGGKPEFMYISDDKGSDPHTDFFDMNYNRLDMRLRDPNSETPPEKPICFEKMKELSAILSEGIPHLRVDFYQVNGRVYVGELTFFHCGGFVPFSPDSWNTVIGDMIDLDLVKKDSK